MSAIQTAGDVVREGPSVPGLGDSDDSSRTNDDTAADDATRAVRALLNLVPGALLILTLFGMGAASLSVVGIALEDLLVGGGPVLGAAAGMGFSTHRFGEVDLIDAILSPAFVLSSAVATGIGTFGLFGYQFSESVVSVSGGDLTIATIISLATLGIAYGSNQVNYDELDQFELGVVLFGVASTLGLALVPAYSNLVLGSQAIGAVVVFVHGLAYYTLAYY